MEAATDWQMSERTTQWRNSASGWAPVTDAAHTQQQQSDCVCADAGGLCASVLSEQIAMLQAWLSPGSTWERRMTEAQLYLADLRAEREQTVAALAALQEALVQVKRQERRRAGVPLAGSER